jgi:RNA polymerase sigma-70 factor, ECF subfamily
MGIQPPSSDRSDDPLRSRFEATFDAHHIHVLAFALRRVEGRAAAEDVVAETFAVAWRRRDVIPDAPLVWLYAIARRVIANQRRSSKRWMRLRDRLSHEPPRGASVGDPAQVIETREYILAAFSRLSESEREVLRLVAWDEVATDEGAEILDCSPSAFRMRLHRARGELRRLLESDSNSAASGPNPSSRTRAAKEA